MQLALQGVARLDQVGGVLGVRHVLRHLRLLIGVGDVDGVDLFQLILDGSDLLIQRTQQFQGLDVEKVEHLHAAEHVDPVTFQDRLGLVDLALHRLVLLEEQRDARCLAEQAGDQARLFAELAEVQAAHLVNHQVQRLADRTGVLGANAVEHLIRDRRNRLLCFNTEADDTLRIVDVDLLRQLTSAFGRNLASDDLRTGRSQTHQRRIAHLGSRHQRREVGLCCRRSGRLRSVVRHFT